MRTSTKTAMVPSSGAAGGLLLDSGLRYFHAATDNAILLVPWHADTLPLSEALAGYISGYGLARAYVLTWSPPTPDGPLEPADLPPLIDLLPREEGAAPLLLGRHGPDGRLELSFVSGRYGTGRAPAPRTFSARDGVQLAYHHFPADSERVVILVHGASAHGQLYAPFARFLCYQGLAQVYVPNLRGHHLSGGRRGDVDHAAQLEEDLSDLIRLIKDQSPRARIVLAGHSMGAGLVLRFASGAHAAQVEGFMLLAPYLGPTAPTTRSGGDSGWVTIHKRRAFGLAALNALGIRAWNHAPLLEFDLPMAIRDGTEVLRYSYRMAAAMTPALDYRRCLRSLGKPTLALIGSRDEMFDPEAYHAAFRDVPHARLQIVAQASHLGLVFQSETHRICEQWLLETLPS